MKPTVIVAGALLASAASAATVASAHAGAPPAWCAGHDYSGPPSLDQLTSTDPREVLVTYAQAMCSPSPAVEANRAAIEKGRQAWGKRLGLEEAEWADVIAWDRNHGPQTQLSTRDPGKYTAIDQYLAIVDGVEAPGRDGRMLREPIYQADALERSLTEVGRLGLLQRCLAREAGPATWAICQGDVEAFDRAKLHAQLRADTAHPGAYKMELRFLAYEVEQQLKKHAADVAAAGKKDPAYARMFEVAARARAEWASTLGKDGELLALVDKVEAGFLSGSRSARAGCEATTAAMLARTIGTLPARTFTGMLDQRMEPDHGVAAAALPLLMKDPAVNLATIAYVSCNQDSTSTVLEAALEATPGTRGPRTLAFTRLLDAKLQLDDVDAQIVWPALDRPYERAGGALLSAGGVIASVRPKADDDSVVVVKFDRLLVKREECVESHQTGAVYKIHPDGRVEYEQVCDRMAVVTHDDQWMDFEVPKKFQPLLKKGARISVTLAGAHDVIAVWPSAKADAPSWLLGATLQ